MKTPDEIKKGLECCGKGNSCRSRCPYDGRSAGIAECTSKIARDALAYIQQLETERHQLLTRCERLERERDAAVADLKEEMGCKRCSKYTWTEEYVSTDCLDCINKCNWEWRGAKEE